MNILITGVAGFIGFHCVKNLSKDNFIVGVDNINDYYDVSLKYDRLKELGIEKSSALLSGAEIAGLNNFIFKKLDVAEDTTALEELFSKYHFDLVLNLAAQAGVRYSIEHPECYVKSNVIGFFNIIECCRKYKTNKIVYASSSSVYGNLDETPFSENANVNSPESLYAATKITDELFANVYNKIYGLSFVGLRFFTVYGPWGRPDMAPFLFTNAIMNDKPIRIFGNGELYRDFTYIDDIVNGIVRVVNLDFSGKNELLNIGHGSPIKLIDFVNILEKEIGKSATKIICGMQPGDVYTTYADTKKLERLVGYKPSISLEKGIHNFVWWYKQYTGKSYA